MSTTPPPSAGGGGLLDRVAGASFLLFVATLPWSVAPMSVAAGLCALLTAVLWLRAPSRRPATPVLWPALAWLVALALSSWFALDRAASLPFLKKALFPLLVPLAATHAQRSDRGPRALAVLLASAAAAALWGLALFAIWGGPWPARAVGAVGHYMAFGGQLMMLVGLAAAVAVLERRPRWRRGALLTALVCALALAVTLTRSAWLGLGVALAVLLGLTRPRRLPVLVAALALAFLLAPPSYRERALSAFDPHHPNNVERTHMWHGGIAMFRDHPLTGVGSGDFMAIYDRYMPPGAHERAAHLHSTYVQIAASMGLVGLVAFVLLYGSLFAAAARGLRATRARGGVAAGLRVGVTVVLVAFLVAGLFEWNFADEELLYLLYTLVGMAWAARAWDSGAGASAPGAGDTPA